MPNWGKIKKEYEETEIKVKDICKKHKINFNTLQSRIQRESWKVRNPHKNNAQSKKSSKSRDKSEQKLTDKQKLFCLYYIKNFNATMAYLKAYKCSYDTAGVNGNRLLGNTRIENEIQRLKEERNKSIRIGKNDIIERHMKIAFADMTDYVDWGNEEYTYINEESGEEGTKNVNIVKFKDSNLVDGGLIREIKQGKDGASIKLEDRQKSLDWLAKYFEMNPMDNHKKEFDYKNYIHKKKMDEEKLEIDKEKLKIEKDKLSEDEDKVEKRKRAIKEYLEATKVTKKELEELFADEE